MNTKKQLSLAQYKNNLFVIPVWNLVTKVGGGMINNYLIAYLNQERS
jgi:hypothetical protein